MTSFKQKTQKYYEAVGVFSEKPLPLPFFLVHTIMVFTEEIVQYHWYLSYQYSEDNVKDLPV